MNGRFTRRGFVASVAVVAAATVGLQVSARALSADQRAFPPLRGRLKQGLTPHLFEPAIEDTCRMAAALGIRGLDFASDPPTGPY